MTRPSGSAISVPDFSGRTMCSACARVLVDHPGGFCPACRLVRHHVRRGERVAGDQRRLGC